MRAGTVLYAEEKGPQKINVVICNSQTADNCPECLLKTNSPKALD